MNILMIDTTDFGGGAARVMNDLVGELRKEGHTVRCLVGYKYMSDKDTKEISTNWFWKFIEGIFSKKIRLYFRHLRSFLTANDIDYYDKEEILRNPWFKEADIVHLHNLHGQYFNLNCLPEIAAAKPVIMTIHDMWPVTSHCGFCHDCQIWNGGVHFTPGINHYQPMLWDNSKYLFTKKQSVFSKSKLFLATPSNWMKDLILKNDSLSKKSCEVISNGIDLNIFKTLDKNTCRKSLNLKCKGKIYIFVANKGLYDKRKGGSYLREIIGNSKYSNDLFLVVGGGSIVSANNAKFFPYISDKNKMARLYNAADAYLDFSQLESFGLVKAEARACGLKILNLDDFSLEHRVPIFSNEVKDLEKVPSVTSIPQMKVKYMELYTKILSNK